MQKGLMTGLASLILALFAFSHLASAANWLSGIPHEPNEGARYGHFIIPNEKKSGLFWPTNHSRKGVLIAVGTFRALVAASQGQFSHAILLDADPSVVEFNRFQIDVLRVSLSAGDFLARVSGFLDHTVDFNLALQEDWEAIRRVRSLLYGGSSQNESYAREAFDLSLEKNSFNFLSHPELFFRLKQMASQGRIVSVNADLGGDITLPHISRQMRAKGLEIGVIDVSNAFEYFLSQPKAIRYIKNLRGLPFAQNAVVNFTVDGSYGADFRNLIRNNSAPGKSDNWIYLSMPATEYRSAIQTIAANQDLAEKSHSDFIKGLYGTSANLLDRYPAQVCVSIYGSLPLRVGPR
jgi:hypothetical protein